LSYGCLNVVIVVVFLSSKLSSLYFLPFLTGNNFISTAQNRRPYNLYCVGADVKPCSINLLIEPCNVQDLKNVSRSCGRWV